MERQIAGGARTIILTGGTSGIGRGAATAILQDHEHGPWHLVLPVRDVTRGQETTESLAIAAASGNTVEAMTMDLASLESVRTFAAEVSGRLATGAIPPVHAVVCNAGVQMGTNLTHTVDGFESTFGINHLGHFVLVNALLPVLKAPGRVIVTSSGTHDPRNPGPSPAWSGAEALSRGELAASAESDNALVTGQRRYSTSKLANLYFTYALARRLPDGVTANAFDPGMVLGTGLGRSLPAPVKFLSDHVFPRVTWLLRRTITPHILTPAESGGSLAWLATAPELAETTGQYFFGRNPARSSDESYEIARAEQLWTDSEKLTVARV